jgi:hypothetical protein
MGSTNVGDFFWANVVLGKGDNIREMKMCFDLYDGMGDVVRDKEPRAGFLVPSKSQGIVSELLVKIWRRRNGETGRIVDHFAFRR